MGSHSVVCHPTHVNASRCKPSQTWQWSIYLPRRDERPSWPWCWLCYVPKWFTCLQTVTHPSTNHFLIAKRPGVEPTTSRSHVRHYTTKPHNNEQSRCGYRRVYGRCLAWEKIWRRGPGRPSRAHVEDCPVSGWTDNGHRHWPVHWPPHCRPDSLTAPQHFDHTRTSTASYSNRPHQHIRIDHRRETVLLILV